MTALDPTAPVAHAAIARSVTRIASERLMRGQREIIIQHGREDIASESLPPES